VKKAGKEAKAWNKDAEISYEQLVYSINYQQVRPIRPSVRPWLRLGLACWPLQLITGLTDRHALSIVAVCNCN
jgi:hypothetical protein